MKIFLDIDNTICSVDESLGSEKYAKAVPITSHIHRANKLYDEGNHITYWTARGKASGVDYSELTRKQLTEWGCKYHELQMDKPSYDLYVDDKSQNTLAYFGGGDGCGCNDCKVTVGTKVEKGWGHELVIANSEKYCGKVMHFKHGARFSMHYHIKKTETWYVSSGQFEFRWIDTRTADVHSQILNVGDIVTNEIGQPHQLICLQTGDIFEVSTQHFDSDSYRVMKGDSQGAAAVDGGGDRRTHKNVLLLMHMGLGDHIMMAPAVFEVAKQTAKLYVVCKANYLEALQSIYGGVKNLELLTIVSTNDERLIGSEIQRVLGELQKKGEPLAIASSGMYNSSPNPVYPFPCGFYKDIGLDFKTCRAGFKWKTTRSPLLDILKQLNLQHVFVHDVSSTQKADRISEDVFADAGNKIALNPDRNMYKPSHPFYYLAQLFVRTPSQSILDYISIMESAHGLYLIDSCYFSMSAFIDLSAVKVKHLYKRANVKYDWLTPELGWNEILLP